MISYDKAISEVRNECRKATSFKSKHPQAYEEWCWFRESEVPQDDNERSAWWDNRRIEKRMRQIDAKETEVRQARLEDIEETDKRIERLAQIDRDEDSRRIGYLNNAVKSAKRQGCFDHDATYQPAQPTAQQQEQAALAIMRRNYWARLGANCVAHA